MSVVENELTPAPENLVIYNGETSSGLAIKGANYVVVMAGGTLTDSVVTEGSFILGSGGVIKNTYFSDQSTAIYIDNETEGGFVAGSAQNLTIDAGAQFIVASGAILTSATILKGGEGGVNSGGIADDVSVAGGSFAVEGGSAARTIVDEGGDFQIQGVQSSIAEEIQTFEGLAQSATVLIGGKMSVLADAVAKDTSVNGGAFHVSGGSASGTVVSAGEMKVFEGATAENTALNGGTMIVSGAAIGTTIAEGAVVSAIAGSMQNATLNGGELHVQTAEVSDLTINDGTVILEAASTLYGKSVFDPGVSITVNGTIAFDTQYMTATDAQITGAFTTGDSTQYTLTGDTAIGNYLLATDAGTFNNDISFGTYKLSLNAPVTVNNLVHTLTLDGTALTLEVTEPAPEGTVFYVNSDWEGQTEVEIDGITATIGVNAFLTGEDAVNAAKEITDAKIVVAGGEASFNDPITINTVVYSGATLMNTSVAATGKLTVNKGATITGNATYEAGAAITINGTVAFDTEYASSESVQYVMNAIPTGNATYTLNAASEVGTALLISGIPSFTAPVLFREDYELTAGGSVVTIDDLDYALKFSDGVLSLSVTVHDDSDTTPPTIENLRQDKDPEVMTAENVVVMADFDDNVGVTVMQYKIGDGDEWEDYDSGTGVTMYVNGTVYFHAEDYAGNKADAEWTVSNIDKSLDTVAPTVSNIVPSTTEPTNKVVLTADYYDDVALKSSLYRIGEDGDWQDYHVSGVTVYQNGIVYFLAEDYAGNKSEIVPYEVTNIEAGPDDEKPTITDITSNPPAGTWTNTVVTVTAKFDDNVGLLLAQYKIGEGGDWTDYVDGVVVEENGTVFFRAIDTSENENSASFTVENIDKENPAITVISADLTEPAPKVTLTAESSDNVGVVSTLYKVGEDGEWLEYGEGGVSVFQNGFVYFQAFDAAGNASEVAFLEVTNVDLSLDTIAPTVTDAAGDPPAEVTTSGNVTVTAVFEDNVAVAQSLYQIDGTDDDKWTAYPEGGVPMTQNGTVYFKAVDYAGNTSDIVSYEVTNIQAGPSEDTQAPTLVYIKGSIPNTKPTNKDVTVTAEFEDNVGVTSMQYKIGEAGEWTAYVDGAVVSENTTVSIKAFDAAGNSATATYEVTNIDKTLPDAPVSVYVNEDWASKDYGTAVTTADGSHATVGVDAFATGDEANAAVDWDGTIYLDKGAIFFSDFAHNIVVYASADLVIDNAAGLDNVWVYDGGFASITNGVVTNCFVIDGYASVESGAVVDGLTIDTPDMLGVSVDGGIVKNVVMGCLNTYLDMPYTCSMSVVGEGGLAQIVNVTGGGCLLVQSGAVAETVTLAGDLVNSLTGKLFVSEGGAVSGLTVSSGGAAEARAGGTDTAVMNDLNIQAGGIASFYGENAHGSKAFVSGGGLLNAYLEIESGATFTGATVGEKGLVRTANDYDYGFGTAYDTVIQNGGAMQNSGYASNTEVQDGGLMKVYKDGYAENTTVRQGGSARISGEVSSLGIAAGLTVENGGTVEVDDYGMLTGQVTIADGATVTMSENSILNFNISGLTGTETTPLVGGYSLISGAPALTLSVSMDQAAGDYLLVDGLSSFDRVIGLGEYELTVGGEAVEFGGNTYSLALSGSSLVVTVTAGTPVPPTPTETTIYVDTTWAGKTTGETVTFVNNDGETVTATIGTDAFATGDAAAAAVTENSSIEVVGGSVSFTDPVIVPVTVDKGVTITGATFTKDVDFDGTLAFDGTAGQFAGLENVTFGDEAKVTVTGTLTEAGQSFKLSAPMDTDETPITDNPLFGQKVTATINGNEDDKYQIGSAYFAAADGISYVLELSQKGELVFSAVKQEQVNTQNNELVVKSDPNKQLNPYVSDVNAHFEPITLEFTDVLVDPTGEVSHVEGTTTYFNYVEKNTDKTDYTMITLDHAAKLSFTISATDKVKLSLIQAVANAKTGKYSEKSLKTTSVTKVGGGTSKASAVVYLDKGTYYLKVDATGKAGVDTWYNVNLADIGGNSYIYADGDDNTNDWVYLKKVVNERAYASATNPLQALEITTSGLDQVVQFDDSDDMTLSPKTEYTNFVGWGDNADFVKVSAEQPVALSFKVSSNENVKLKVYSLAKNAKGTAWVLKTLQTVTLNVKKGDSALSKTDVLLDRLGLNATGDDATGYYVSVESTNKKGNAYYKVSVNSKVFEDSDFGTNGNPLSGTAKINPNLCTTVINKASTPIDMEVSITGDDINVSKTVGDKTYTSFVGFGDEWDYSEIVLNGTGNITLSFESYGTAKVTSKAMVLKYTYKNGKWVKSSVGTVSVKTDANTQLGFNSKTFKIKEATKTSGDTPQQGDVRYFVAVQAGNAKKNTDVWYNVSASFDGASSASLAMPETDNLAIADSLSFGQNTDALADASAFGLADSQLIDDKQSALGLLA